jgi:hypothetical protein
MQRVLLSSTDSPKLVVQRVTEARLSSEHGIGTLTESSHDLEMQVYDWNSRQSEIFDITAKPIVDSVLEGYNGAKARPHQAAQCTVCKFGMRSSTATSIKLKHLSVRTG